MFYCMQYGNLFPRNQNTPSASRFLPCEARADLVCCEAPYSVHIMELKIGWSLPLAEPRAGFFRALSIFPKPLPCFLVSHLVYILSVMVYVYQVMSQFVFFLFYGLSLSYVLCHILFLLHILPYMHQLSNSISQTTPVFILALFA